MKKLLSHLGKLLIKQCITALLFSALVLGMQATTSGPFRGYTEALGRAIRHETDVSRLTEVLDRLSSQWENQ